MDPNAALQEWRESKGAHRRRYASILREWVRNGGFEPHWTAKERTAIMVGRKRKTPNPRRHMPKLPGRGRPPAKGRTYTAITYDGKGKEIGRRKWTGGSLLSAELAAARLLKGKVQKVVLDY